MLKITVAAALVAGSNAFVPAARGRTATRASMSSPDYLSQIEDDETLKERAKEREKYLDGIVTESDAQGAASNMDAFVDFAEGFDGGDGQVGVVGDGSNAMETFDRSEVVSGDSSRNTVMMAKDLKQSASERLERSKLVADSKSTQILSFGAEGTGYAEELKAKGMSKMKDGEDQLKVRRQQLENWHQQQGLRSAQRQRLDDMDALTGGEAYAAKKRGGSRGYFDDLSGDKGIMNSNVDDDPLSGVMPSGSGSVISNFVKEGPKVPVAGDVVPGPPQFTTHHTVTSRSNLKIHVANPGMAFQDFTAAFTADSHPSFVVTPEVGTLERRNGDPTEFTVIYRPEAIGNHQATLVIKTKVRTWTHVITSTSQ